MFGSPFFCVQDMKPTKSEFIKLAKDANVVCVFGELLADMETPVSTFAKVVDMPNAFLLESAESVENWGRFSFIGFKPKAIFRLRDGKSELKFESGKVEVLDKNPLESLRGYLNSRKIAKSEELPEFVGGAVGYFGYECVNLFERLPAPKTQALWDDAYLGIYDDIIIFDNFRHTVKFLACANIDEFDNPDAAYDDAVARVKKLMEIYRSPRKELKKSPENLRIKMKSNMPKDDYLNMVETAKEYVRSGEIIQVVLSQEFESDAKVDVLSAYRALRFINPSPYMFCLKSGDNCLVGSSPETLVRFSHGKAYVSPIAGTSKRGKTQREDMELADRLLSNPKERAEHLMLVDLGRNDISRFCEPGSVQVNEFMNIQRYSHVMHLVSHITGEVKKGVDAFDALKATFPAGTLSGAPKVRAMQIINELETTRRGPYGGSAGYIAYGGAMDMAITIRTLQIRAGKLSVRAGGGIVYDSDPEMEYEETRAKSGAVAKAIEAASKIELDTDSI